MVHTGTNHRLRDHLRFFGKFLRNPGHVGSIVPSSRYLAGAMTADLDLAPGDLIIEYGPGTGPMTAALAARLPSGARYLGIERDPHFLELLVKRFPHLDFHLGSVADVAEILDQRGLPKARAIISGLPFASLSKSLQEDIARGTREVLAEDGEFRTFQYLHAYGLPRARRFRTLMAKLFRTRTRSRPVLLNVPPAYVLTFKP